MLGYGMIVATRKWYNRNLHTLPHFFVVMWVCVFLPKIAYAIDGGDILKSLGDSLAALFPATGNLFSDSCTWQTSYWMPNMVLPIIQAVVIVLDTMVDMSIQTLFDSVTGSDDYNDAIMAAATLSLIFYGVGIVTTLVKMTAYDAIVRVAKIGVVLAFIGGGIWDEFNDTFITFFQDGVIDLIAAVVDIGQTALSIGPVGFSISTGGVSGALVSGVSGPLAVFADVMNMMFTPRMVVIIYACFSSGSPYGVPIGLALCWATWMVLGVFLMTMEVYCLAIIARAVLLGLAPLFFAFMLFKATANIFRGWFNQLLSFSLQPIFLFAFLSFFIGLMESGINAALPRGIIEACYVKDGLRVKGTLFDTQHWQFASKGQIFEGVFGAKGHPAFLDATAGFPIDPISILILLILVYTGKQLVVTAAEMGDEFIIK
jgi:type IV secretory pathway VirB6-like protein